MLTSKITKGSAWLSSDRVVICTINFGFFLTVETLAYYFCRCYTKKHVLNLIYILGRI
jgi:hypothetical protein